tara:strand:- start:310 stop:918 length:609 start_codon:yes stop_codon:yes gene_type:complete
MLEKGKFYRKILIKKLNFIFLSLFLYFFLINFSYANFQQNLINKYKSINTLHFDFTQKIGNKVEFGSCYIKYPLLMKCEYPKKKKSIISNGKKFVIVKRRYKKIYFYPLKKTALFYLLNKEYILNIIEKYEPIFISSKLIQYELVDEKENKINIFFDKNSLDLAGWKTIDAYSNEVSFLLRNIESNISIKNEIFKIPKEKDL